MRQHISLDGVWKFCPAFVELEANQKFMDPEFEPADTGTATPHGQDIVWIAPDFDDTGWLDVNVPGSWNVEVPDLWSYEGHGWYRRTVRVPEDWTERRVLFHSDGANYRAVVYVDGVEAGSHDGGYVPFDIPIDHLLRPGENHTVAISVENLPKADRVPGGMFDWWNHGGLYRSVKLTATDRSFVENVVVVTEPGRGNAEVTVTATLRADGDGSGFQVTTALNDSGSAPVAQASGEPSFSDGSAEVELTLSVADARLWSPDEPNLYELVVDLIDQDSGTVRDRWIHRIGIRSVVIDGTRLLLNGEPFMVKGVNHYEDSPDVGRSVDLPLSRKDIALVKSIGGNTLRCHFPNSPEMYDLCDEMGVFFVSELPLYQWGRPAVNYAAPEALDVAKEQLTEMIDQQRNHPCILMWSVSNECMCTPRQDDEEHRKLAKMTADGNIELVKLARQTDPTRAVVEVANTWPDDPVLEHTDILAINMYAGASTPHIDTLGDLATTSKTRLQTLREAHPNKPILIAEFGGWAIRGLMTDYFPGEPYQAELLRTYWEAFMEEEDVVGGILWTFADSDVHRRFEWVYEYRVSYGLYDIERRPKQGADMMRRLWTKD